MDADSARRRRRGSSTTAFAAREDFKRIKALRTAGAACGEALDRSGARKASATGAEEMRSRMLRAADKSAQADRRVNPDALAAVGLKRAHDKESRLASIMAGREDRAVFGAAKTVRTKSRAGPPTRRRGRRKTYPSPRVSKPRRTAGRVSSRSGSRTSSSRGGSGRVCAFNVVLKIFHMRFEARGHPRLDRTSRDVRRRAQNFSKPCCTVAVFHGSAGVPTRVAPCRSRKGRLRPETIAERRADPRRA